MLTPLIGTSVCLLLSEYVESACSMQVKPAATYMYSLMPTALAYSSELYTVTFFLNSSNLSTTSSTQKPSHYHHQPRQLLAIRPSRLQYPQ